MSFSFSFLTLRRIPGRLASCFVASARRAADFLQTFHQHAFDMEADLLFSGSRGGYGGGGYGGGGGGFGGGGDRMSNLGAGLQKQSWGKSSRNINNKQQQNALRIYSHANNFLLRP